MKIKKEKHLPSAPALGTTYTVDQAYALTKALMAQREKLATITGEAWQQAVTIAKLVPAGFPCHGDKIERELQNARKSARRVAALAATPRSETMHIGVLGEYNQALIRKIDERIGTQWLAVNRLYQLQPSRLTFSDGKPNGERRAPDENLSYYIGIPEDRSAATTTAIICSRAKAAILKIHGMVGWEANLDPGLERYFRSQAEFDWDAQAMTKWVISLQDPDDCDQSPWSVEALDREGAISLAIADWREWCEAQAGDPDPEVVKVFKDSWIGERV